MRNELHDISHHLAQIAAALRLPLLSTELARWTAGHSRRDFLGDQIADCERVLGLRPPENKP